MKRPVNLAFSLVILSVILPLLAAGFFGGEGAAAGTSLELRRISLSNQAALVFAVYLVKPVYMILALGAILVFWKRISPALTLGLIFFLAGETACAINILFFFYESVALEYLHSYLMVVCLGFLGFAAIEAVDHNLLHFSDAGAKCALTGICRGCVKARPGRCILKSIFQWSLPLAGVVALMPLIAQPKPISYNVMVFGFLRNLSHPLPIQNYEITFSPLAGLALLGASWSWLSFHRDRDEGILISKIMLAGALGYLGFSFMRLAFFTFYWDNLVWFVFWEELTELILVVGIIVAIWLLQPEASRAAMARAERMIGVG